MTAVDTNILVRVFTRDTTSEAERAFALLQKHERIFIAKTVLLEVEWVLRRGYGYRADQILALFRELLDTPKMYIEDEPIVVQALLYFERGLDFADALHVASAPPGYAFVTFDIALQRAIGRLGLCKVAVL